MKQLKVYYNPNANYDGIENTNANIWVSIDGLHLVDPITASELLIKGEVLATRKQRDEYDPVGIFSKNITAYETPDGKIYGYGAKTIDYKTITPAALRQELLDRVSRQSECLVDPEIEIECIRGFPPT